jgi:hypothetical protein
VALRQALISIDYYTLFEYLIVIHIYSALNYTLIPFSRYVNWYKDNLFIKSI